MDRKSDATEGNFRDDDGDNVDGAISFRSRAFVFDDPKIWTRNWGRRDRFRQKIVEIGAIFTIFKPFEV